MSESRRVLLNPCDYFFFAHHRMMQRRSEGGNIAMMTMEVEGHIEPDHIRTILRQAFIGHPVLMSPLRLSVLSGRPYWAIPDDKGEASREAVRKAHVFHDLRDESSSEERLEQYCQDRYGPDWDYFTGPQIVLEQYALPWNQTRFCLRWPHLLMDAAGAQWFLAELSRLGELDSDSVGKEAQNYLPEVCADYRAVHPLQGHSMIRRMGLFLSSFSGQRRHGRFKTETLFRTRPPRFENQRYIQRAWDAECVQKIKTKAEKCVCQGPGLYVKYLAACVIRAVHRIFADFQIAPEAYLISMPQSVSEFGRTDGTSTARPVPGNYLVSPTLWGRRDLVHDKRALCDDLDRQLNAFRDKRTALKQWAMLWVASSARAPIYQWLIRLPLGFEALSSGYSYFREISRPLRHLCGARVTNLWGAGPLPTPPGWNPVFTMFDDKLNLALTYSRPAISDNLARRYIDLIESEIFETS